MKTRSVLFSLKYQTWTTARLDKEDIGHYFSGTVTQFIGIGVEPVARPVLIEGLKDGKWRIVVRLISDPSTGAWSTALPLSKSRRHRALVAPSTNFEAQVISRIVNCAGAVRPGGGC